jgi:hypothetical protein
MHGSQMMYATLLMIAQAAPAAMPSRGQANPTRLSRRSSTSERGAKAEGISVSSRWGWGPSAIGKEDCNPALTALFTPWQPRIGRYEVCTVSEPIEQVKAAGAALGVHYADVEALEALDAFGSAGSYDRFAMTQLYGGTRASVAHGWREDAGTFESVTLISPYPDVSLSRLMPGTMVIRLMISR